MVAEFNTDDIIDAIADGLFIVDHDFNVVEINSAALAILDLTREDALGKKCFEIFHASVCETSCVIRQVFENDEPVVNCYIHVVDRNHNEIPVSVSASALRDTDGRVVGGVETFRDMRPIELLRKELRSSYTYEDIISKNERMRALFDILPDIAASDSTVLLLGESGTGKELFARAIHSTSSRYEDPFVAVNLAALPDELLESELFGYMPGAFTGAIKKKEGRIATAQGGTLFLDEIGEVSPALQVKLLRFIQFKEYSPLGSNDVLQADVRIIAATNRNLTEKVAEGSFREDLFYRLSVISLNLPPLRERLEDIPILVEGMIQKFNILRNRTIKGADSDFLLLLMNYTFPGNVRELENIIEYSYVVCKEEILGVRYLPPYLIEKAGQIAPKEESLRLEDVERRHIMMVLELAEGNKKLTAAKLGINPSTLWRKLKAYGLD